MDILLKTLDSGFKAKTQGHFETALRFYNIAQKLSPLDSRSYTNSMKVLMGTGDYEAAVKHLLILCHFKLIEDSFSHDDEMADFIYRKSLPKFQWRSNELLEGFDYEPNLLKNGLIGNSSLKNLIYYADNLTFYIGHCYVGEFKDQDAKILKKFGVRSKYFDNLNSSILGIPGGETFRNTPEESYFLNIGFIYAHMNLNLSLKTKKEVIDYYLNSNTKIRKDIWNYGEFLPPAKIAPPRRPPEFLISNIIAQSVEQEFNTKIFKFGIAYKGTNEFKSLAPAMVIAPDDAEYLFWFLIPIDGSDNVITNDYYEKEQRLHGHNMFSSFADSAQHEFQSILVLDWVVSKYIQEELMGCKVYDTGSVKVGTYGVGDNIVANADKIDDLRYRYFRLYSPLIT